MEFAYNNSYHSSSGMSPFEAMYGRPCRTPLCWTEVGERGIVGPKEVEEMTEKVKLAQKCMKIAQDRQKRYVNQKRREVIFEIRDFVYLKIAAKKGRDRFGKVGKLGVRYIGPYRVCARIGEVSYRLELPESMKALHPVFHVSMLRRHIRDPNAIEPERIADMQTNLTYPEGPLSIGVRRIRTLRKRRIPQVQVFWGKQHRVVITWEDEENFRKDYPELFEGEEDPMNINSEEEEEAEPSDRDPVVD